VGQESGVAEETCWGPIVTSKLTCGDPTPPVGRDLALQLKYWFTGESAGDAWMVPQADVSIRPGWFYHEEENARVKDARQLMQLYYQSVGRNAVLLLNLPPDRRGLLPAADLAALKGFKACREESFGVNLAAGARATGPAAAGHPPGHLFDGEPLATYWRALGNQLPVTLEIELPTEAPFDRIVLQEPIQVGQRIGAFTISAEVRGQWRTLDGGETTTIGYKRILCLRRPVLARRLRITVLQAVATPCLSNFEVYLASPREHQR
jgi:alpha-L-fucosidase